MLKIDSNYQCKAIWYLNTHCYGLGQTELQAVLSTPYQT